MPSSTRKILRIIQSKFLNIIKINHGLGGFVYTLDKLRETKVKNCGQAYQNKKQLKVPNSRIRISRN